jgi:hypothetical protein
MLRFSPFGGVRGGFRGAIYAYNKKLTRLG